jgi:transposase
MDSKREAASLRTELGRLGPRGRGRAYPEAFRVRVIAYVEARRAEGASARDAGAEIGVDWRTLLRWSPRSPPAAFERVVVRDDVPAASPALIMHGPCGIRIEGLDLASVVELLRRLA